MNHSLPELFRVCGNQFARTNSILLGQASVYSSLTSWDEYGWAFPDELCMSSFPNGLPYDEWTVESVHSHFVGSRVYVFPVITCHLHFWQNDRGISQATGVTQSGTDTEIKASTESQLRWRKISCCSCRGSNLRPSDHESGALRLSYIPKSWRKEGSVANIYQPVFCAKRVKDSTLAQTLYLIAIQPGDRTMQNASFLGWGRKHVGPLVFRSHTQPIHPCTHATHP